MTEQTAPEATCDICGKAKPLHRDTSGNGDGMICVSCQEMVNMGLDWIQSAIAYLQDPPAQRLKKEG